jgi:hypothetical protein
VAFVEVAEDDSFGGGNEDPYESPGTIGSINLTAPDEPKEEEEKDQPFFPSVIGVLDSVLGSIGATPPEEEEQEGFTISSDAAPVPDPKPMKDLIPGFPDVPVDPADMPLQDKTGFGATIKSGNIYTMKDDEGNVTGTLSALETLQDMKDAQDEYNLNFAGTTGTTFGDSMTNMPTLLDSLTGEALGQQMPNLPLGTVATQEQFENQEQFIPPDKLFGIFDPVYASPQKSFDAQLQMGQEKDSGSAATTTNEPIFKYFQRAYKGGIPDRFLSGFLTRFGYSPTFIDQQMQVNEDGEIVDSQGNLIEGLPNVALIGEQIKQQVA